MTEPFRFSYSGIMKSDLKELEIRPASLFRIHLDLAAENSDKFFADAPRERMACPACDSEG
jgi:hypothetical protein